MVKSILKDCVEATKSDSGWPDRKITFGDGHILHTTDKHIQIKSLELINPALKVLLGLIAIQN